MTVQDLDLTACDREPIHIPGSIQPHGIMLVVETTSMKILHVAGDVEGRLGVANWEEAPLSALLGEPAAAAIKEGSNPPLRQVAPPHSAETFDITCHWDAPACMVELEAAAPLAQTTALLPTLESAAREFDRAGDLTALVHCAARAFRSLTGFDRVMVYRFLEDGTGKVVGEDAVPDLHSFLHHRFPASDIPQQARALYVRNLVRVIPDVEYVPAPLRPARSSADALDMSDCSLRSVSPVHLQYLRNMDVAASASVSIVKDGSLWGLIACHHSSPRGIPADLRVACRALAGALARQIKAREDTDAYRERVRLRTVEDRIVELLLREGPLEATISSYLGEVQRMLDGDGVAVIRGKEIVCGGKCPPPADLLKLASWVLDSRSQPVFSTNSLTRDIDLSEAARPLASGMLAMTLSVSEPWLVLWLRAEELETVKWAGNPHKAAAPDALGKLTPRASFESWSESVSGKARRWTVPEIEAAGRLAIAVTNVWQSRRIRDLNKELLRVIDQKDALIQQREFLLGEVNHRVQNSLQLVSSFLALQARDTDEASARSAIEEARRRIAAVALVHRRLYNSEQINTIDAARYVDELLEELLMSLGDEWRGQLVRDLHPVLLPNDRAVTLGLILTELVINANKYAYGGRPGPLRVTLSDDQNTLMLSVSDDGIGRAAERKGFGSRMMEALVNQIGGNLTYSDNRPGTRAVFLAPIEGG